MHKRFLTIAALAAALGGPMAGSALAADALPAAANPELEARMVRITAELRCLVCQNQTVADSNSELANDLRQQVREMLDRGATDAEIIAFMTARYGDFVLYRPPVKGTTALLWAGPALLLLGGAATLVLVLRRRARLPAEAFDVDETASGAAADDAPGAAPAASTGAAGLPAQPRSTAQS
ncbi:cytochrome C biogenesis protein [Leptothrix cholodnii SP-6]|uniref:Cytochrome c-type biogenesis protein n=1 Tax=Leptothrix cholodnii (strain ATCC 51168 / LMG 8142 / SP-6) TaxID=395495 RepID=B1XWF1_LEPCP|nr:cytochrome c-type biogenesis protein [Leptothrix cholodnii]ACB33819.1 cytochrome C biogenesis protein [Leptothrix cholodnii SP-6]